MTLHFVNSLQTVDEPLIKGVPFRANCSAICCRVFPTYHRQPIKESLEVIVSMPTYPHRAT
jgi:hypothetical protein